jgi:YidC/Oxa1 family membrane protein insertase
VTILLAALLGSGSTTTTTVASGHKAGTSLLDPIAKPVAWVLEHIYAVVPNYGVAILILSLLWMIIISPLTLKSTRSMLAMQKLQPQLKKLQEQHKNDKQAFAQAQMELFREHQVSPFGSCLPMLLPLPVFFALFRVIQGLGRPDPKYLSHTSRMYQDIVAAHGHLNAFGMDLSQNAFSHHSSFFAALPFWILLLVMAGTGYLQSAQMMSRNPNAAQNPQMRLMKYLPLLFVIFFIRFPAGVLLYYAMSNVCRIVQQDAMYRFDPRVETLVTQEVQEVEANTLEIDERQAGRGKGGPAKTTGSAAANPKPGAGSAKPSATSKSGGPTPGRSRFRDLLAAATEQQQPGAASTKALAAGDTSKGSSDAKSGSPTSNGNGNGSTSSGPATNGKQPSASQSRNRKPPPKPPPKGGHRTNRKRRGR